MSIQSINPYNGKILKSYESLDADAVERAVRDSFNAFTAWNGNGLEVRRKLLHRLDRELENNKRTYARLITLEMGKPITESVAEIEKCARLCGFYAKHGPQYLADEPLEVPDGEAYIHYNPLGPVLAVMPWNFPFWQVLRFAVPATLAGNTALLKHASNVPQCASAIQVAFEAAGFPRGVFINLPVGSDMVPLILDNPLVKAATLTGSEGAGSAVARKAGENLKKTVLELGGSDPFIVLKDARLEEAAETAARARMINTGQSCIAAKRFIVEKELYDPFLDLFRKHLKNLRFGDPMDETTDYATLARKDLAEEIDEQVKKSLDMGAELLYGTPPKAVTDAYYPPLILGNVRPGMPAFDEEIFGPVAVFFKAENADETIAIANDSAFGLGGSVWSQNIEAARKVAHRLESGAVYINQLMFSDPHVPFGGIKKSGYGRELSHLGIREFTNQKTVWIKD
jgi:succinate-semialdehyde dehydrogenase/glutarate-semialdehyde dehydrogenase